MKLKRVMANMAFWLVFLTPFSLFLFPLLKGEVIFWGTAGLQFIPWRAYGFSLMKDGIFPFWNPLNGFGSPLLANYQTAFLYPLSWFLYPFYLIGDVPALAWAYTLLIPVHLGLAGVGMALLLRELGFNSRGQVVAGIAFSLCGYFVARASFFSMIWAGVWLPWLIWAIEKILNAKRATQIWLWVIGLGLIAANQLLAGHAQLTWYSLVFAGIWNVFRVANSSQFRADVKKLRFVAGGLLLAVLLASVQLYPTFEYLLQSQRAGAVDYEYAMNYSFWPWRLLGFFLPDLFGNPGTGNYWGYGAYWEDAVYIGLFPLLLAISTIRLIFNSKSVDNQKQQIVRLLWVVTGVAIILSLGKNTPVFPWLYRNVPTFDMFQAPTRWMYLADFSLAVLSGIGAHLWQRPTDKARVRLNLLAAASLAICLGAVAGSYLLPQVEKTFIRSFVILGGLLFTGTAIALTTPKKEMTSRVGVIVWNTLAVGLILADLWIAGASSNPFIKMSFFDVKNSWNNSDERVYIPSSVERRLKFEKILSFRDFNSHSNWDEMKTIPLPNMNLLFGGSMVNNFDPLITNRFNQLMEWIDQLPTEVAEMQLEKMGVGAVIKLLDEESLSWQKVSLNPEPRIEWRRCQRVISSQNEETLNLMVLQSLELSPDEECIIVEAEDRCQISSGTTNQPVAIQVLRNEVSLLEISVSTDATGWVRVADSWYPGWTATLDGHTTTVERVDFLFKGVCVPPGSHSLTLSYQPTAFYLVLWISASTGLLCLISMTVLILSGRLRS